MALVTWNNNLSVHIESVDNQHKKLIEMINEFYDNIINRTNIENISKLISELKKYIVEHFSFEEKYMKQFNYIDFRPHKAEHDAFVAKVNEVEEKINNGKLVLSLEITSFLFDWLKNHIQITDKKYSDLFIQNGIK